MLGICDVGWEFGMVSLTASYSMCSNAAGIYKQRYWIPIISMYDMMYMALIEGRYSAIQFRSFFNSSDRAVFHIAG